MGEILMLLLYALGALAIGALVYAGRGACWAVREIILFVIRFIQHEMLMRPKTRYYVFR